MAVITVTACATSNSITAPISSLPNDTTPPAIQREMRGLWIATVANIDWPSRTGLSAGVQQAELIDLLDRARAAGLNAVMFHVRPASDAVYRSAIEPWASMLTGVQGGDPGYDPLEFAVTAAHARGLELHAWINPFRAGSAKDSASLSTMHAFNAQRNLVRVYGTQLWLDPGEPAVRDLVMRVVSDIVRRYDIDGVHADDYFYPYQEDDSSGKLITFPDSASYARSGSTLARDDWRRQNVDQFVERLYRETHAIKPTIKVGISPFGIWRPGFPASVTGLDAFATIYADSRKWLQQGWVDYLAPQLYWAISAPQQGYGALLDWWIAQSTAGRHVWPGLAAYRVENGTASAFSALEIPNQVALTRTRVAGTGNIFYNANTTLKKSNGSIAASLATLYATPAIVPASPWLDSTPPLSPTIAVSGSSLQMLPAAGKVVRWWIVRSRANSIWTTRIFFGDVTATTLEQGVTRVLVNAVDQAGNLSLMSEWKAP
ncbi:MAG: family 10 glycosylhydrolase [Gemmatimonadaceae bacterium]